MALFSCVVLTWGRSIEFQSSGTKQGLEQEPEQLARLEPDNGQADNEDKSRTEVRTRTDR
jgi:hypothetical protein